MSEQFHPPVQLLQLRPGCMILYSMNFNAYTGRRVPRNPLLPEIDYNHKYTGLLNWKSISKLRFCINLLVEQSIWKEQYNPTTHRFYKFKINFITLTLSSPQKGVSDRVIKNKMLEPFLRNMRNVYKLRSYVWRAERQENGNIHFHVTCDIFIPYDSIRDAWNLQLGKFHFITDFKKSNKSEFPNSTDVHAVHSIRDLAAYLSKYMSKIASLEDVIEGKVWDCSKNLKVKDKPTFEVTEADYRWIDDLFKKHKKAFHETEYCTIIRFSDPQVKQFVPRSYLAEYDNWLTEIRTGEKSSLN